MTGDFTDRIWPQTMLLVNDPEVQYRNYTEFYRPVFQDTVTYRRISGYFTSSSLYFLCECITDLIENDGKMMLIVGSEITDQDREVLESSQYLEKYLDMKWSELLKDVNGVSELKNSYDALAWLLANDRLELKIAINVKNDVYQTPNISKFHEKIALYEDSEGNLIASLGSPNETLSGYMSNRESISISNSWENDTTARMLLDTFNGLWNNTDRYSKTFDVPDAIRERIIESAPDEPPVIRPYPHRKKDPVVPRDYQLDAIRAWRDNNYQGILNMATGTGKTITAVLAIKECNIRGLIVIVVPQRELINQWIDVCRLVFPDHTPTICGTGHKWKDSLSIRLLSGSRDFGIIIAVRDSFRSKSFMTDFRKHSKNTTLIVDEVHEIGASKSIEALKELSDIPRRMGLSATPERMRDESGNEFITEFFGGKQVFEYSMFKAIYPDQGGKQYLSEYNYYMEYVSLDEDELDAYNELSVKIAKLVAMQKNNASRITQRNIDRLAGARSRIVKGCRNRLPALKRILEQNDGLFKKCIIYCNTVEESKKIYKMLYELNLPAAEYHSKISDRTTILRYFSEKSYLRFLISIGCLDQGVDIPNCDGAIIMSSTKNPRQYVQRRGRVLRMFEGKTESNIFDMVITPYDITDILSGVRSLEGNEKKLLESQLNRAEEFASSAKNGAFAWHEIMALIRRSG